MYPQNLKVRISAPPFRSKTIGNGSQAMLLTNKSKTEVLNFLAERPLHTVAMTGFIRDNELVSPANRGAFYGVRNDEGKLEGVALIGHATLMETRTQRAVHAFAEVAQKCSATHMILGEQERIGEFWAFYKQGGQEMRLACRESLFEIRWPIEIQEKATGLRLATVDELELIIPVQAQMAQEQSGINPLEQDPEGFSRRCRRRIELERTWILVEAGSLIFKADVIADTHEVAYLEGVWVNDLGRGDGQGVRCMAQLSGILLQRAKSISLLVDENNKRAQGFYKKCGFKFLTTYDTIFLAPALLN
ncbi:MAG: GNAT family N-acetyltransferase [Pyrinomonadaceae bacterium]